MMPRHLSVILTGALLLGTAGVVAPLASAHVPVTLAQAEDEGISAGEMITVEDGDPDFVEDAEYEVMEDTEGVLFVEGEDGSTWEIISVSEDGDDIELEYDGRIVSGDDVDS
jgi:hypothetical protein